MRGFIITLCFVLGVVAPAQIPGIPTNLLSPNAASLGEYGEVPVSLYTGIPEISIPLYTIELGEYSVPISMSYHAGGVRPDQHVGWTGLGWTLNAGGCISRIVNGIADEYHIADRVGTTNWYAENLGFYYNYSLIDFNWTDSISLKDDMKRLYCGSDDNPVYFVRDTEPDKFMFNFLDYHGNFYLDTSGKWQIQCDKPVKVEFNNEFSLNYTAPSDSFDITDTNIGTLGRTHSFKTFTIIGEDGTKYIFGDNENAIEYSMDFFSQNSSPFIANSWFLSKIVYPNNRVVKFTYEREDFIAQFYDSHTVMGVKAEEGLNEDFSDIYLCMSYGMSDYRTFHGHLILPTYLSKIEYGNGFIKFSRTKANDLHYNFINELNPLEISANEVGGSQYIQYALPILRNNGKYDGDKTYPNCLNGLKWHFLSSIIVYNSSESIKKFFLSYNNNPDQRLTLKSIYEVGGKISIPGRLFKFEYHKPELLPNYLSTMTDHWGFYNERTSSFSMGVQAFYNSKNANPNVSQYGVLTKIIYPTGGFTKFIYEPHDCIKQVNSTRTGYEQLLTKKYVGGLRIKRIVNSPSGLELDTCIVKEYFYVSDFLTNKDNATKSSGVLCQRAEYYFNNHIVKTPNDWATLYVDIFSSQSILSFYNNTHGAHIGYSQVVERLADGSFSIYKYSNFDTGQIDKRSDATIQGHTIYESYSSRDQERGLLLSKTDYDSSNNKTRSMYYTYEKDRSDSDFSKTIKTKITPTRCDISYVEATAYRNFLYTMRPTQIRDTIFNTGYIPIANVTEYEYDNNRMIYRVSKKAQNEGVRRITLKYPPSFINNSVGNYRKMCDSNRISPVIEQIEEEIATDGTIYLVKKTFYHYDDNIVKPSSIDVAYGANAYEKAKTFEYDCFFNPIREYNYSIGVPKFFIWGYSGVYPVAVIEGGVSTSNIDNKIGGINDFTSQKSPDMSKIEALRSSISGSSVTSLYYTPLVGITKRIEPNGTITLYEYDYLGRLVRIKDLMGNVIKDFKYNLAK